MFFLVGPAHVSSAASVLARAFIDDPGYAWIEPDPTRRVACLAALYEGVVRSALPLETTWAAEDAERSLAAVAAWWAPGESVGLWQYLRAGLATLPFRIGPGATTRTLRALGTMESEHARVAAGEPHWFLDHLGVDPPAQGRGLGRRLVSAQLAKVDAEGVPALLHTSKERNLGFYASLGFQQVREVKVGGAAGFTLWTMRRAGIGR